MRMTKLASLLLSTVLSTAALATAPEAPKTVPGFKLMEHQKMTMGDEVIYEADVNLADPSRKQYGIEIGVADKKWQYLTLDGAASATLTGTTDANGNLVNGWMVSYVVTDVTASGDARVELVYTIRDPGKAINKTEHVHADLKIGQRFTTTTASGTPVWLIVSQQPN